MRQELFDELRRIRNEFAHGHRPFDLDQLGKRLSEHGLSVPAADLAEFSTQLLSAFGRGAGMFHVPQMLHPVLARILEGKTAGLVCDPWAGMGSVLATVVLATRAKTAAAFTQRDAEATLGRVLLPNADWHIGEPLELLDSIPGPWDVVASVLPFGLRSSRPVELESARGGILTFRDDLAGLILGLAATKLSAEGVGLFVIPQSFFISPRSVLRQFDALGLGMEGCLALPSGAFAPYANISTYLVIIRKRASARMFVAQLSSDTNTNVQVIENFRQGKEGATPELGRFTETLAFTGMDAVRTGERLAEAERRFGSPALRLENLATAITLGRSGKDFGFPVHDNAIFVPLIGVSSVLDSLNDATLKHQNYAQVVIDPARSDARFVARFLNSELGKDIRCGSMSGFIPKLNTQTLKSIRIVVPDLHTQRSMLAMEAAILAEQNTLFSLQTELSECRRDLWAAPRSQGDVGKRLGAISARLSGDLKRESVDRLDQWCESLPFPMASILRAWQATPSDDFKTRYEHLLHFFEATAEFFGIILLSAFSSREQVFEEVKKEVTDVLRTQNLSFKRGTFGTWKVVTEYLGKQVRQLLSGNKDQRATCVDMFADPNARLPEVLGRKEVASILSTANKMRNDWTGHGGVVGQEEAHLRNEQLLSEVAKVRDATGDLWACVQLLHARHCRPRRGLFENEVAILMGSNSEFLQETRAMPMWLDVERLYLVRRDAGTALQLLPLVQVGPSPSSAKNACYFFNRIEKDGLRYVSYHYLDQPERKCPIEDAREVMSFLQEPL
jgi:hypothetical protein